MLFLKYGKHISGWHSAGMETLSTSSESLQSAVVLRL